MTKLEGALLVIIFILVGLISGMCCWAWQEKQNEKLMFAQIEKEIIVLQEKNQMQDELIGAIIRTEAITGIFDKKE